jgi:glycosyltransferase involved in cell wall biosynthesis
MLERPLRIGFLTPEYPTEGLSGGIGSYVRQMAYSLSHLGHSVFVLLWAARPQAPAQDGPVTVCRVGVSGLVSYLPQPLGRSASPGFARHLASLARELKLDLFEAPEFFGVTAFLHDVKPRTVPVVVRLHTCFSIVRSINKGYPTSIRHRLRDRLVYWLERRAIVKADSVTAVSGPTVDLTRKVLRLPRDDFYVIPNPVHDLFFSPAATESNSDDPVILFVGRLEWLKGPELLVKALPYIVSGHPNARLHLVGRDTDTGPGGTSMLAYLSSLVPEPLRDRVAFLGCLSPEQLVRAYHQAAVCVFPSRWEGFGLVCAEAMACGRPVVVSDIPAFRDMVSHGTTGLIVKGEDPEAFSSAVNTLLCDSGLRTRLGASARQAALERFQGSKVAQSTLRIYHKALASA